MCVRNDHVRLGISHGTILAQARKLLFARQVVIHRMEENLSALG